MPRRYSTNSNGIPKRTWGGKHADDFTSNDVRAFLADTDNLLNNTRKEHDHMPKTKQPAEQSAPTLKIDARVYPLDEPKGSTVAFAGININDAFAVHGLKVINGEKGMFVAMPGAKDKNGDYRDVAFPISAEARKQLSVVVLDAYAKAVEKSKPELAATARTAKEALEKPSLTGKLKEAAKESAARSTPAKEKSAQTKEEAR